MRPSNGAQKCITSGEIECDSIWFRHSGISLTPVNANRGFSGMDSHTPVPLGVAWHLPWVVYRTKGGRGTVPAICNSERRPPNRRR